MSRDDDYPIESTPQGYKIVLNSTKPNVQSVRPSETRLALLVPKHPNVRCAPTEATWLEKL